MREGWVVDLPKREIAALEFADRKVKQRAVVSGADRVPSSVLPDVPLSPNELFGY